MVLEKTTKNTKPVRLSDEIISELEKHRIHTRETMDDLARKALNIK